MGTVVKDGLGKPKKGKPPLRTVAGLEGQALTGEAMPSLEAAALPEEALTGERPHQGKAPADGESTAPLDKGAPGEHTPAPVPGPGDEWLGSGPPDALATPKDVYEPATDAPLYKPKAIDINAIIDTFEEYYPNADPEDVELIRQAYTFAALAHKGGTRLSGEPYLSHPLAVASILANMKLDAVSIAAGLLHDTVEDTKVTIADIRKNFGDEFGPTLATIIDGVTKFGKTNFKTKSERQAANLFKMVFASLKDLRVMLVKLADRLHNMRTLSYMRPEKRREIASETLDYYAPFATRLGIHKIKAELEDLSLFHLHPKEYTSIIENLATGQKARERYVDEVKGLLSKRLAEYGIEADVAGRNKHIYSIWRKMRQQNIPFEQIYDLFAFRIIVNSVENCYKVLGLIHTIFSPLPGRFKDYISLPKPNGYRSLHTAVVGPENTHIEIQIRTFEMHSYSEDGVAAHWRYKVGSRVTADEEELISKFRETVNQAFTPETEGPEASLATLKEFLDSKELIYVLTPKGDIKQLPVGSTPIDFAYSIHTDIGNTLFGAFVDGAIVPLDHKLQNGVTVRVVTSKFAKPSRDWLSKVASAKAKTKIRQALLEHERGDQEKAQEKPQEKPQDKAQAPPAAKAAGRHAHRKEQPQGQPSILVKGEEGLVVRFGKCCKPIPGEPIVGFLTKGSGVTVHSRDCESIPGLPPDRLLEIAWNLAGDTDPTTDVYVKVIHNGNANAIPQIINAVSVAKATIIEFRSDPLDPRAIDLRLALTDYDHFLFVRNSLSGLKPLVTHVERFHPIDPNEATN
ncbi:MAG: bifunctional (p)ppGpp synthetase/guanosine-3',5'-bis(diphosphate) 3'-pyrophosphohydrolase [Deltaproteobacteria bacterium]|jgi:GTP pyrophosphokinase|nr:bifunctional (p)ppGpp synthetase/guanosine-3',5'-bis(diphosphate) 3'-pyrophosphohydrolase [Deltaproteobacteria bacterium]